MNEYIEGVREAREAFRDLNISFFDSLSFLHDLWESVLEDLDRETYTQDDKNYLLEELELSLEFILIYGWGHAFSEEEFKMTMECYGDMRVWHLQLIEKYVSST